MPGISENVKLLCHIFCDHLFCCLNAIRNGRKSNQLLSCQHDGCVPVISQSSSSDCSSNLSGISHCSPSLTRRKSLALMLRSGDAPHTHTHTHSHTHAHAYTHTNMHSHAHTQSHTRTCIHTRKHAHTQSHTRARTQTHPHTNTHTCTRTHAHTGTRTQTRTNTQTHTRTYTCTNTHTNTHTHNDCFGGTVGLQETLIGAAVGNVKVRGVTCQCC